MEIKYGGIYKSVYNKDNLTETLYRLVIGDVFHNGEFDDLFVFSMMGGNEEDLFLPGNVSLEHPSEDWHFVRLATPEEFKQALVNFLETMKNDPKAINYDYEKEFGKSSAPRK